MNAKKANSEAEKLRGELAEGHRTVICEWHGDLPTGGRFLLLRGQQGAANGRVLLQSVDAHRFVDTTPEQGVAYLYTVIVMSDGSTAVQAHSNQVLVT